MPRPERLTERAWPEIHARPLLSIPVGSCEQHGPHLPLGTDTIVAGALALALARRVTDVLVGPPLAITASGEHAGFPGTLSIGTTVMTTAVVELVRSADWAAGVVLVNGHGGNREAVGEASRALAEEGRAVLAWWPHVPGGDAHAGRTETSLLLALRPESVRLELAAPGARQPLAELAPRLRSGGVAAVSASGVLGDPTGASAEEGATVFAALTEQLVAAVTAWRVTVGGQRR